jgi:hypothetical protein
MLQLIKIRITKFLKNNFELLVKFLNDN